MVKKTLIGLVLLILVTLSLSVACSSPTTTSTTTTQPGQTTSSAQPPTPSMTSPSTTTSAAPLTTSATPTTANWWDKFGTPQYGGTINVQLSTIRLNFDTFDFFPGDWQDMVYEALFAQENWTLDRSTYPFNADFVPMKYFTGQLATSWEMTDPTTMVVHLRQGVLWQNKAPVNGREFVASDVAAHYQRILGPGASIHTLGLLSLLDSVTATDKYTLTVKFKQPGLAPLAQFMDQVPTNCIEAPEYAALAQPAASPSGPPSGGGPPAFGPNGPPISGAGGPLQDWHNVVGTGPWIISDVVAGTSETLTKNADYWGYDERYPENKLPYADSVEGIIISDTSTALAALRTGKIDIIGNSGGGQGAITWQQAAELAKTNPDLQQEKLPGGGGAITMRVDKTPFTDIRVREALNMAIDRQLIAKGYYGGTEDGIPAGMLTPDYVGYAYPYSEWSQDLKDVYSYNIGAARKLMTAAGYPNGFKTDCIASTGDDLNLLQVLKAQLLDIGVDMEIQTMDPIAWQAVAYGRQADQMISNGGTSTFKPANQIQRFLSTDTNQNTGAVNDPTYDKLAADFNAATTEDASAAAFQAVDKYALEQAWIINVFPIHSDVVCQPWLKGYSGEAVMWNNWSLFTARWWIDQSLKK